MMQIAVSGTLPTASDFDLISQWLALDGARLLELGCGTALTTRRLAENLPLREIIAMEVDRVQHDKNLQIRDLENENAASSTGPVRASPSKPPGPRAPGLVAAWPNWS